MSILDEGEAKFLAEYWDERAAYDAAEESDEFLEACRVDTTEFDLARIRTLERTIADLEQDIEELNEELADLLADQGFYI